MKAATPSPIVPGKRYKKDDFDSTPMKALLLLFCLTFTSTALAQSDTAHHRKVYQTINDSEKSLTKVNTLYKDEPTIFNLTGYFDGGEVKKIIALCGDDGAGVTEYYLEKEKPLFVYNTYHLNAANKKVEERLYFKEGSIFKWLTTEKPGPALHGEDYQATTNLYITNTAAFVTALKKAKGKATSMSVTQKTEGTFLGIEEGDYAHWQLRTTAGEEVTYFILKPDASVEKVLENPKAYQGRRCRVTWKKSTENIPEAGGKIEVEQILSFEWLKK